MKIIIAIYLDGSEATYTEKMLDELKMDKFVRLIYDEETGEVLWDKYLPELM